MPGYHDYDGYRDFQELAYMYDQYEAMEACLDEMD